jgi:hypothetical protein
LGFPPCRSALLNFPLALPLFFVGKQISITLEHGFGCLSDYFHAILRGVASFPHFMGSRAPKIMEDFPDILRRFALALALGADFLSIQ